MSDWGQGVVNNTIEWGRGSSNNSIGWGSVYADSPSGDTALKTSGFANTYSLSLDESVDQYAEVGNVTSLNGKTAATWSFWMKRNDAGHFETPLSQHGAGADRQFYFYLVGNNRIDFYINNAIMFKDTSLTVTFANDTWYHIALTYDGSLSPNSAKCNLYINGVKETNTQGSNVSSINSSTTNFNIGRRQSSASAYDRYFDGNLDEIALFDKALSQSEITAIASAPSDLTGHDGLTDWWRMGDDNGGTGTTLTAAVGGVNGALYNSASYEANVPT